MQGSVHADYDAVNVDPGAALNRRVAETRPAPAQRLPLVPSAPAPIPPMVRGTRAVALAGLLMLIGLGLAWELWLAPTGRGTWALKVLPLVFCVAGLLRHRMYTFRWLSLLLWLYVMEGLVRAFSERGIGALLAGLQVLLSLVVFIASAVYIRWRLRHAPPLAAA